MSGSRKRSTFHCFVCKQDKQWNAIAKSGRNKRGWWFLCKECSASYKQAKNLESGRVLTDSGYEEMGWNGVPSERSLRARRK